MDETVMDRAAVVFRGSGRSRLVLHVKRASSGDWLNVRAIAELPGIHATVRDAF